MTSSNYNSSSSSKKKVPAHIHKYHKVKWGKSGTVIWKCAILGCSHYLHVEFILGKNSICWKCGTKFLMTYVKLLRNKPKCDSCQHRSGQGKRKEAFVSPLDMKLPLVTEEKRDAEKTGKKREPSIPDLANINIDELLENL